ncbi:mucin-5AC-like [Octopus sinensis]|uniref:Mucin-5AC-like n=1 Tax=Octopus sinensis TaxID=2607531 RepID=A0A7E6FQ64_9MOLL|nr:mucin-5AC-like [Octopus sinensis]
MHNHLATSGLFTTCPAMTPAAVASLAPFAKTSALPVATHIYTFHCTTSICNASASVAAPTATTLTPIFANVPTSATHLHIAAPTATVIIATICNTSASTATTLTPTLANVPISATHRIYTFHCTTNCNSYNCISNCTTNHLQHICISRCTDSHNTRPIFANTNICNASHLHFPLHFKLHTYTCITYCTTNNST